MYLWLGVYSGESSSPVARAGQNQQQREVFCQHVPASARLPRAGCLRPLRSLPDSLWYLLQALLLPHCLANWDEPGGSGQEQPGSEASPAPPADASLTPPGRHWPFAAGSGSSKTQSCQELQTGAARGPGAAGDVARGDSSSPHCTALAAPVGPN